MKPQEVNLVQTNLKNLKIKCIRLFISFVKLLECQNIENLIVLTLVVNIAAELKR